MTPFLLKPLAQHSLHHCRLHKTRCFVIVYRRLALYFSPLVLPSFGEDLGQDWGRGSSSLLFLTFHPNPILKHTHIKRERDTSAVCFWAGHSSSFAFVPGHPLVPGVVGLASSGARWAADCGRKIDRRRLFCLTNLASHDCICVKSPWSGLFIPGPRSVIFAQVSVRLKGKGEKNGRQNGT